MPYKNREDVAFDFKEGFLNKSQYIEEFKKIKWNTKYTLRKNIIKDYKLKLITEEECEKYLEDFPKIRSLYTDKYYTSREEVAEDAKAKKFSEVPEINLQIANELIEKGMAKGSTFKLLKTFKNR